jgi:hypothetical protein
VTETPAEPIPPMPEAPEVLPPPEVVDTDGEAATDVDETVDHPAKVMRIGTMLKQLLEEVRSAALDEPSRDRLREIYDTSVAELGTALSPDLQEELSRLALPFAGEATPTAAELQIAKAQLVGWLEGLVQGMQAMLFAQQMAAQQQLQSMRGQLPSGARPDGGPGAPGAGDDRPGTYL